MLELLPCKVILCHVASWGTLLCEDVACKSERFVPDGGGCAQASSAPGQISSSFSGSLHSQMVQSFFPGIASALSGLHTAVRSKFVCSLFEVRLYDSYSIRARSSLFQPCWLLFLLREGIEYGRMRLNNRAVFAGYEIQFPVINLGVRRPVRKA